MKEYKPSDILLEYLRHCGLSEKKIARANANTSLYHDLGLYGDIAEAYIEVLVEKYQVDMTGFEFDKHFPPEFVGGNVMWLFYWLIPFAGHAARRRTAYLPVTMEMIDRGLLTKKWNASSINQ